MRFSIVVINHNYAPFLAEAVTSALRQTRAADEVLVIDDGSTDDSLAQLQRFGDSIRVVTQANAGHVRAFERGFAESCGDAVIFLDADDRLNADCLAAVEQAWVDAKVVKVQYRLDTIDTNGVDQKMVFPYFSDDLTPERLHAQALRSGVYPWTVSSGNAYARTFLDRVLPIDLQRFPRSPDGYVNKLAPLYGAVVSLNRVLGAYRVHGANAWAQGQGRLNGPMISQTAQLDLALHDEFVRRAHALEAQPEPKSDLTTPQHLEYRLLGLRLAPDKPARPGDTAARLLRLAIASVFRNSDLSASARTVWTVWFIFMALGPRPLVSWGYRRLRGQTGRARLAKAILVLLRHKSHRPVSP